MIFSRDKEAKLWLKAGAEKWRQTDYPTAVTSFHRHYERRQSLSSNSSPLLGSACSAVMLWKWSKTAHLRNSTPSHGENSDVQSYWCKLVHCTISAQALGVGGTMPGDVSAKRKMKILLIGGTGVQSECCPSV